MLTVETGERKELLLPCSVGARCGYKSIRGLIPLLGFLDATGSPVSLSATRTRPAISSQQQKISTSTSCPAPTTSIRAFFWWRGHLICEAAAAYFVFLASISPSDSLFNCDSSNLWSIHQRQNPGVVRPRHAVRAYVRRAIDPTTTRKIMIPITKSLSPVPGNSPPHPPNSL